MQQVLEARLREHTIVSYAVKLSLNWPDELCPSCCCGCWMSPVHEWTKQQSLILTKRHQLRYVYLNTTADRSGLVGDEETKMSQCRSQGTGSGTGRTRRHTGTRDRLYLSCASVCRICKNEAAANHSRSAQENAPALHTKHRGMIWGAQNGPERPLTEPSWKDRNAHCLYDTCMTKHRKTLDLAQVQWSDR